MRRPLCLFLFAAALLFASSVRSEEPQPAEVPGSSYFENERGEPYTEEHFTSEFLNMLLTLGLLIGVLVGGTWMMKRMLHSKQRFANATSVIKVLEQRSLSTKTALYLVQVEGKTVLIADSQSGVTKLTELPSDFQGLMERGD